MEMRGCSRLGWQQDCSARKYEKASFALSTLCDQLELLPFRTAHSGATFQPGLMHEHTDDGITQIGPLDSFEGVTARAHTDTDISAAFRHEA